MPAKLRVCCRLRPCGERENAEVVSSIVENDRVLLRDPRHKGVDKMFSFDRVYGETESNEDIFQEELGREQGLARLFEGRNITIFAHGATGSGKTFTMQGSSSEARNGIVPQTIETVFDLLAQQKDKYVIKFSLYEIYCEKIRDLLAEPETGSETRRYAVNDLPIQKDICGFEVVADIKQEVVTSPDHFNRLYRNIGRRCTEKTNVNEGSSRSHCCAQICVEKVGSETKEKLKRGSAMTFHEKPPIPQLGRLFLVDLAGCEDNRLTGNKGQRMTESQFINDTYLALVKVFGALKRRQPLSAFCRDAKLTRLLRGALEDDQSPTFVFITISPSISRFQATLNTFSYLHFQGEPVNNPSKNAPLPLSDSFKKDFPRLVSKKSIKRSSSVDESPRRAPTEPRLRAPMTARDYHSRPTRQLSSCAPLSARPSLLRPAPALSALRKPKHDEFPARDILRLVGARPETYAPCTPRDELASPSGYYTPDSSRRSPVLTDRKTLGTPFNSAPNTARGSPGAKDQKPLIPSSQLRELPISMNKAESSRLIRACKENLANAAPMNKAESSRVLSACKENLAHAATPMIKESRLRPRRKRHDEEKRTMKELRSDLETPREPREGTREGPRSPASEKIQFPIVVL